MILSGGDPLLLKPATITRIARALGEMAHVGTMRVHTRLPIVAPERIDEAMIRALTVKRPTYVVVHVNHADEMTPAVEAACGRLASPLISSSVSSSRSGRRASSSSTARGARLPGAMAPSSRALAPVSFPSKVELFSTK